MFLEEVLVIAKANEDLYIKISEVRTENQLRLLLGYKIPTGIGFY